MFAVIVLAFVCDFEKALSILDTKTNPVLSFSENFTFFSL